MLQLPNILTLLRILLIPVFVLLFLSGRHLEAALVFGAASLTDALDGYLARLLRQESPLGSFLDPVADKLMVATALVLVLQHTPTVWLALPVAVIVSREIAVSALREWMAELGARRKIRVSVYGKYKTISQMIAIFLLVYKDYWSWWLGLGLLYLATALTLVSMFFYLHAAWPELVRARRHSGSGNNN